MTALSSDQARIEALAQSWLTQDKVHILVRTKEPDTWPGSQSHNLQLTVPCSVPLLRSSVHQNPSTRAEIQGLLDTGKYDELALRLGKRIGFGTAGAPAFSGERARDADAAQGS